MKSIVNRENIIIGVGIIIYIVLHILLANSQTYILKVILVTIGPITAGVYATYNARKAWSNSSITEQRIWQFIFVGIGIWTIAEIVWMFTWISEEFSSYIFMGVSGLSLLGSVPICLAMVLQILRNKKQITWLLGILAIICGFLLPAGLFWIFQLLIQYEAQSNSETLLMSLYPIVDIIMATGGFLIVFTIPKGQWKNHWLLIGTALVLWGYSDIWFWLLNYSGAYDLGMVSAIKSDIPYVLAYVLFGLGCGIYAHNTQKETAKNQVSEPANHTTAEE